MFFMHCVEQAIYVELLTSRSFPEISTLCGQRIDFREGCPMENWENLITAINVEACGKCDALVTLKRLEDV